MSHCVRLNSHILHVKAPFRPNGRVTARPKTASVPDCPPNSGYSGAGGTFSANRRRFSRSRLRPRTVRRRWKQARRRYESCRNDRGVITEPCRSVTLMARRRRLLRHQWRGGAGFASCSLLCSCTSMPISGREKQRSVRLRRRAERLQVDLIRTASWVDSAGNKTKAEALRRMPNGKDKISNGMSLSSKEKYYF